MIAENGNPGAVGTATGDREFAIASKPESKPSLIALQARLMVQRFGMLPDQAIAVAFLAFEHSTRAGA